jgi:hypothetical protein
LADTHWIGGSPEKLEVYGCAAWSPRGGTLTLRNPNDKAQTFSCDVQNIFEIPSGAPTDYILS